MNVNFEYHSSPIHNDGLLKGIVYNFDQDKKNIWCYFGRGTTHPALFLKSTGYELDDWVSGLRLGDYESVFVTVSEHDMREKTVEVIARADKNESTLHPTPRQINKIGAGLAIAGLSLMSFEGSSFEGSKVVDDQELDAIINWKSKYSQQIIFF